LTANPRTSRSVSAAPRSPATVEKRRKSGVLFADFRKDFCFGVLSDIVGDGQCSISTASFGMNNPFGNPFTIEVGEFFHEPNILEQCGTVGTCGLNVLVVGNRSSRLSG
jgi:hypothetical protein